MHHAERLRTWRTYLTKVFLELHEEGALAPGVTPELAATTMVAIQDGIQIQWLYDPTINLVGVLDAFIATVAPGVGSSVAASS